MGNTGVNGTDTLPPDELVVASAAHGDARARSRTRPLVALTTPVVCKQMERRLKTATAQKDK